MRAERRSPRRLATALERHQQQWAPETLLGEVQQRWADAVGELIAAHSTPVGDRAGVLTISCSSAVWAQELELMSTPLLTRLNELLGGDRVKRLRCVSTPPPRGV